MQADCYFGYSRLRRPPVKFHSSSCTELLLQREPQLVLGLQRMYHRLVEASAWHGPILTLVDGQPLTHDILSALNILDPDPNPGSVSDGELFDTSFEDVTAYSMIGNSSCAQLVELTHLSEDRWFAEHQKTKEIKPMPRRRASVATDTIASTGSCNIQSMTVASSPSQSTVNSELTHPPDKARPAEQTGPRFRTLDDPMFAILNHHTYPVFRTLDDPMFATLADESWDHLLPLPDISD